MLAEVPWLKRAARHVSNVISPPAELKVLRSPAGARLRPRGSDFVVCEATRRKYPIVNGTYRLFDDADVSPLLGGDHWKFELGLTHSSRFEPAAIQGAEAYKRAKALNTGFMFTETVYDDPNGRRVLEIGVGEGELIGRFADLGFDAYGVDFFPWLMDEAVAKRQAEGRPTFTKVSAPMARLPFADGAFDLVFMHATLHHALPRRHEDFRWSDPANMHDSLAEIRRVLKPRQDGGMFLLMGEGVYPEGVQDRYWERACQETGTVYESWYTMREYESAFAHAGLFPNLFTWNDDFRTQAWAYTQAGEKHVALKWEDLISEERYGLFGSLLVWNLGAERLAEIFPPWAQPIIDHEGRRR